MFFLFIGGVGPHTKTVKRLKAATCPNCGQHRVRIRRRDKVFSLFFIPVVRLRKGHAYKECKDCGWVEGELTFVPVHRAHNYDNVLVY